jgi:hypothetical protein
MTVDLFSVGIRPAAGILLAIPYSARVDVALGGIVAAAMVVVFLAGWRLTRAMWRTTKAMRLRQRREIVRLAQGGEPVAESSQAAVVRAYAEARLRWSDSWPYRAFIRVLYPMWMALSFAYPSAVGLDGGSEQKLRAPGRNRTCDTRFRKPLRYPLRQIRNASAARPS